MTAPVAAEYLAAGDYESALLIGMAELLRDELGWSFAGSAGAFPVVAIGSTPDSPDRVVVLDTYGDAYQDPVSAHGELSMQLRFRSRRDMPLDVKGTSAQAFTLLHGSDRVIGGVPCRAITRISWAPLGRDTVSRRWERTDNYSLTVDLPATANRQ